MTTRTGRALAALTTTAALTGALAAGSAVAASTLSRPATRPAPPARSPGGSLPKTKPTMVSGPLTNIRAGRHTCFDRLVVDLRGKPAGYRVSYVDQIIQDGSGTVIPVRGGAKIKFQVNAPS